MASMTRREALAAAAAPPRQADAPTPVVRVEHVGRRFNTDGGTIDALTDASFDVMENEFISLVGQSGCGKSTLLNLVAALDRPTTGTIYLNGKKLTSPSRATGIVYQQPTLLAWRTTLENILLPVEIHQGRRALKNREVVGRAKDLISLVGLEGFRDAYPHQLSGGMQQRVSIARALITEPRLLLMDEPFGALDALTREQMNEELLRVWATTRNSVIFVTHSVEEAVFLSDKVVMMSKQGGGTISGTLNIGLPRPRETSMLATAESIEAQNLIRSKLHG